MNPGISYQHFWAVYLKNYVCGCCSLVIIDYNGTLINFHVYLVPKLGIDYNYDFQGPAI